MRLSLQKWPTVWLWGSQTTQKKLKNDQNAAKVKAPPLNVISHTLWDVETSPGTILQSKGMHVIFQKKGKNMLEKGQIGQNI